MKKHLPLSILNLIHIYILKTNIYFEFNILYNPIYIDFCNFIINLNT